MVREWESLTLLSLDITSFNVRAGDKPLPSPKNDHFFPSTVYSVQCTVYSGKEQRDLAQRKTSFLSIDMKCLVPTGLQAVSLIRIITRITGSRDTKTGTGKAESDGDES